MSEKEAWLALRDVVHGLEYRKDFTQQPSTQVFHNEAKNFKKVCLNFFTPKDIRQILFFKKRNGMEVGISN
jgi:hypothetical protein